MSGTLVFVFLLCAVHSVSASDAHKDASGASFNVRGKNAFYEFFIKLQSEAVFGQSDVQLKLHDANITIKKLSARI